MRYLLLTILLSCCYTFTNVQANNPQKHRKISKKEFRERQAAFLAEKAQLTNEESTAFFPVYFELQDKKENVNKRLRQSIRSYKDKTLSEKEYDKMIDLWLEVRAEQTDLETDYTKKFRKILPAEKIFKLMHAEMKFHRSMMKIMHKRYGKEDVK